MPFTRTRMHQNAACRHQCCCSHASTPTCNPFALVCRSPALVAVLLIGAVVTGSGMPVQALLNGVMTKHLGTPFRASAVSFAGGALVLGFLSLLNDASAFGEIDLSVISPWMWMGGLCGALAITGNIIGVAQLGAAAYSAIFVATQVCVCVCVCMCVCVCFMSPP